MDGVLCLRLGRTGCDCSRPDGQLLDQGSERRVYPRFVAPKGTIAAEVVDNRLYLNPDSAYKIEVANHSLTVYDQDRQKVLNVIYLNARSVRITGIFEVPGYPRLVISDTDIFGAVGLFKQLCSIDNRVLFAL